MSLRNKLLATYIVFVAALAVLGAWSAWQLEEVGAVSQRILSENYESVVAAQSMKESLERQDSAALFAQLGQTDRARRQLEEHRRRFDAAFTRAEGNITEPGEEAVIAAIRRGRDEYYRASDERADYFGRLEPQFNRLRSGVDRLLQLNQEAMLRKSADANRVTARSLMMTVILSAALVVLGLGFAVRLSAQIDNEADRLKSEFVGIASHELRTPLMTLRMGIDLIKRAARSSGHRARTRDSRDVPRRCGPARTVDHRPARPLENRIRAHTAGSCTGGAASLVRDALEPSRATDRCGGHHSAGRDRR